LFEVKKKYHKILLQVEPPVVIDVDSTDGPDGPGHDVSSDAAKSTDNIDTETNSSTTQKLPEKSTGDRFSKNGNNQISSGKKAASSPLMDSPGSCLSSLPVHLEPARRELLSWLSSDNPDEEKCYKLLRDMEVINEDGYFAYDDSDPLIDLSETSSDVLAPPATLCNDKRPMEPSHQDDGQKIKKNKTWGPTHGTRQSSRIQGNAGKTIMDLAKENKKKQNLEVPVPSF
jgi:hypothetical protein